MLFRSLAQDYDGKTWAWDTSGVASIGTYTINVWVRAIGDGSAYQTFGTMPFTLT